MSGVDHVLPVSEAPATVNAVDDLTQAEREIAAALFEEMWDAGLLQIGHDAEKRDELEREIDAADPNDADVAITEANAKWSRHLSDATWLRDLAPRIDRAIAASAARIGLRRCDRVRLPMPRCRSRTSRSRRVAAKRATCSTGDPDGEPPGDIGSGGSPGGAP